MAAAEMAAAPVKRRRREKALIVTSALPAESFFAGSVGTTRQERKLTTWRRMRVTERGESELTGLVKAEQLEQRCQIAEFLARCRRGAADEVEDLAVLQSVIGEPLHLAILVEIDRDHALVDDLLVHERDFALRALRDVIEYLAVQGCDRRRG